MIYDAPPTPPAEYVETEAYEAPFPSEMESDYEPQRLDRPRFVFDRSVIPIEGGRVLLRLRRAPVVEVDPSTMECEVLGWDVRIPHHRVEEIPRRMARRFLELFSKADAQRLSEQQEAAWMRLQEEVDYGSFCAERAAPQYMEGTILRQSPVCRVEWHDGTSEFLAHGAARSLQVFEPGERFGGFVKLGRDGEPKSVERVTLLEEDEAG